MKFYLIGWYQQKHPFLTAKSTPAKYNDIILIPYILQIYVVKWYNTYILNTEIYRTEAMIWQHYTGLASKNPPGRKSAVVKLANVNCQLSYISEEITWKNSVYI